MRVPCYGLHSLPGGIEVLVQRNRVDHALDLSLDLEVEVDLVNERLLRCPHEIRLGQAQDGPLPEGDPLIDFFLPRATIPEDPLVFLEDAPGIHSLVLQLLRLGSCLTGPLPVWSMVAGMATRHMQITNLTPLVLYGIYDQGQALDRCVDAARFSPRRICYIGVPGRVRRPEFTRIEPRLEPDTLANLPLEQIGAARLKARMLGR